MSLVRCNICKMNTLISHGKCQHCGSPIKISLWNRKMRRREAYGILLIVIGLALLWVSKAAGAIVLIFGGVLIAYTFVTPRVRY